MKGQPFLWICIVGILLIAISVLWCPLREGFQQDFKTLNIPYMKEVFLVGNTGDSRTPSYQNGVLPEDAAGVCQNLGASLATLDQLKLAMDASANWCKAGAWIAGDSANLYYPSWGCGDTAPCSEAPLNRSACIRKIPPQNGKGFVACYGTKPELGTTNVQPFNTTGIAYSVLDTQAVADTLSAGPTDSTDITPYAFTPSQALWALEQTRFTTVKKGTSPTAREYLRANIGSVNTAIRNAADPDTAVTNEDLNAWQTAKAKTCQTLSAVRDDIVQRIGVLKQVIASVEGKTRGTFYAKQESMELQRQVSYVCAGYTPEQSPACGRLASIDFDLFYKPNATRTGIDTKVLSDLQSLNYNLRLQECTIQVALGKLQILSDTLMCPAADAATMAVLGDYKVGPTTYYPPTCKDLVKEGPEWAAFTGANEKRFTIGKNIGYVSSETLRVAFEEISPFFQYAGYDKAFTDILQYLSILIRIPDLNDYYSSDENFKSIGDRVGAIVSSVTAFFST